MQPYELAKGPAHWDTIKHDVAQANLNWLRRFSPNLTDDKILASVVESPLDLERRNPHNWRGSCHGGAQNAAQSAALPADRRYRGETSAREVFDRLAGTWIYWGWKSGYFDKEADARAFFDELRYMLETQRAAPNSKKWFNKGMHWA